MTRGQILKKAALRSATILSTVLLWSVLVTFVSPSSCEASTRNREAGSRAEMSKILSVLESKRPDKKIIDKAAEKLHTMSTRKIRLMYSLCERISEDGGTAGADIAFSLVTALIVLS